jgi:ubiquinone biosynthesis protein COQ9
LPRQKGVRASLRVDGHLWQQFVMDNGSAAKLRIRQAAFALAERMAWNRISMGAIARQADLSLAQLLQHAPSKAAIIEGFASDIDRAMLLVFEKHPPEGGPHDRLFDVMLKRLEILAPYRHAIESILKGVSAEPPESLRLLQSAYDSVGWMISAARVEEEAAWQSFGRLGLLRLYLRILAVWTRDDAGLSRSMATLDRGLRDLAHYKMRADGIIAMAQAFAAGAGRLAQAFFEERKTDEHRQDEQRDQLR